MKRNLLALLALALGVGACKDDPTGLRPGGPNQNVDVSVGTLSVELRYGTQLLSDLGVTNLCEYQIVIDGQHSWSSNDCTLSTKTYSVKAGDHKVAINYPYVMKGDWGWGWGTAQVGTEKTVSIVAGATTTLVVDLSTDMGIAKGTLTVNGAVPTSGEYGVCITGWGGHCGPVAADGAFAILGRPASTDAYGNALPGNDAVYAAHRQANSLAHAVSTTFAAGQTLELGTVNATPGTLRIQPTFNGTPLTDLGFTEGSLCSLWMIVDGRHQNGLCKPDMSVPGVMSGTRDVKLLMHRHSTTGYVAPDTAAKASIAISGGLTTSWAPDFGLKLGMVQGQLTNSAGTSLSSFFVCLDNNGACTPAAADGTFKVLSGPGSSKVIVRSQSWSVIKELPYTVEAGKIVDLGSIATDAANLTVRLLYNGVALPQTSAQACNFSLWLGGNFAGGWFCDPNRPGVAELRGVGVGTHTLELRYPWDFPIAQSTVTLAAGETQEITIEIGGKLGLVTATVRVNGSTEFPDNTYMVHRQAKWAWDPTTNTSKVVEPGLWISVPTGGVLRFFDHPGARLSEIRTMSGFSLLSEFGYSVVAGQTTIIGTTEGGAAGKTETGTDVTVKPVDTSTGGTFVELTFAAVKESGTTTVSSSTTEPIANPLPDSVTAGSNPVYYEIASSAVFEGKIRICFNYGDNHGFPTESAIRLYHGLPDGTWEDVTSPSTADAPNPDTEKNIICGDVSSLSPFVLVQKKVANQAPTAKVGGPYSGDEGAAIKLSFGGTDPEGETLSFSWDLGNGVTGKGGAADLPTSVTYKDNLTYTVKLTATDPKGNSDTKETSVTVANVSPGTVDLGADIKILEGETLTRAGSFKDPGADSWTATVNYGDGSPTQALALNEAEKTFTVQHTYAVAGKDTVKVTVTDDDRGSGTGKLLVEVQTAQTATTELSGAVTTLGSGGTAGAMVRSASTLGAGGLVRESSTSGSGLNRGEINALQSTLQAAATALGQGRKAPAVNQLNAFVNQVDAFVKSGRITAAQVRNMVKSASGHDQDLRTYMDRVIKSIK